MQLLAAKNIIPRIELVREGFSHCLMFAQQEYDGKSQNYNQENVNYLLMVQVHMPKENPIPTKKPYQKKKYSYLDRGKRGILIEPRIYTPQYYNNTTN